MWVGTDPADVSKTYFFRGKLRHEPNSVNVARPLTLSRRMSTLFISYVELLEMPAGKFPYWLIDVRLSDVILPTLHSTRASVYLYKVTAQRPA